MKVVTFGEIMIRMKTPGAERLFQSPFFEATFGGGEANVAVSLANFGFDAAFFTVLPKNALGDACISELRRFGVNTSHILRLPGRMGIYFLEVGANQLPSKVIYDREFSAIAIADPKEIDWKSILASYNWFHVSGITPALSENAMQMAIDSVRTAKELGVKISSISIFGKTCGNMENEQMKSCPKS
jgi:2-dehydro-3-deoxygluconokinase